MRHAAALLLALIAGPAAAGDIGAAEFEAATTGRTFFYSREGRPFGAEQYLPGRRVIWAFTGDDCLKGYRFADGPDICFVYEDAPGAHCWRFRRTAEGLAAWISGAEGDALLIARRSGPEPMACLGPDVGA